MIEVKNVSTEQPKKFTPVTLKLTINEENELCVLYDVLNRCSLVADAVGDVEHPPNKARQSTIEPVLRELWHSISDAYGWAQIT